MRQFVAVFIFAILVWRGTSGDAQEAGRTVEKSDVRTNPVDAAEMVLIPGGEFVMGSDEAELKATWKGLNWNMLELEFTKSEQPSHRIRVDSFWMYRHLVTVAQYRRFCMATGCEMPPEPSYGWADRNPVVNVSWNDANTYCKWAGSRLPSEAEWEYAARGGNTGLADKPRSVFVWGNQLPTNRIGNLADEDFVRSGYYDSPGFHHFAGYHDGYPTASPVDAFPPNNFGVCDLAGNVLEWCEDWYSADYYAWPTRSSRLLKSLQIPGDKTSHRCLLRIQPTVSVATTGIQQPIVFGASRTTPAIYGSMPAKELGD